MVEKRSEDSLTPKEIADIERFVREQGPAIAARFKQNQDERDDRTLEEIIREAEARLAVDEMEETRYQKQSRVR
jgi:hypothetical protein